MPSREHAVLVDLLRSRPALVPLLLRSAGLDVPAAEAVLVESTFPVAVPDFQVDLAVTLGEAGVPSRLVALLEVQLSTDEDKPHRWLLYQAAAQDRHRCAVVLLVVAPERRVARWARRRRPVGPWGSYAPCVFGPDELRALARAGPQKPPAELAVLGALALDPRRPDRAVLRAAGEAIAAMDDDDRVRLYIDLLESKMGDAFLAALEGIMIHGEPLSDRAKAYYRAGMAQGKAEGEAQGEAKALLTFLAARSLPVTPEQRDAILACGEVARLERWIARAVTAATVADVLAE